RGSATNTSASPSSAMTSAGLAWGCREPRRSTSSGCGRTPGALACRRSPSSETRRQRVLRRRSPPRQLVLDQIDPGSLVLLRKLLELARGDQLTDRRIEE